MTEQVIAPVIEEEQPLVFETGNEKESEAMKQQRLGAIASQECDKLQSQIDSLTECLPDTERYNIIDFLEKLKTSEESPNFSYIQKQNALSFLLCKVICNIEDVVMPPNLLHHVKKVMDERSYTPKLKDSITILLSHVPERIEKLKESLSRQQLASDFSYNQDAPFGLQSYTDILNLYRHRKITFEEFKKLTDNDRCKREKAQMHKHALDTYGWAPVTQHKGFEACGIGEITLTNKQT